ncbi:MAG: outer membrane lipoprotein carrier protein LolA [Alphaproteobacteria bacterium]|nr:outer membrane lipoprotein carrier protein LolA [Alphaproteobacteria bacterium]
MGILAVAGALLLAAMPPARAAAPRPVTLTTEQQALVSKIEAFVNDITTIEADFVQMSGGGGFARGTLYLQRPGRMRFEYEPPVPYLLISNGTFFIYVDNELEQVTYLPLSQTPADLLLRENFSLSEGLILTGFKEEGSVVKVEVADSGKPDLGRVTLTFNRDPLSLKSWTVLDPQAQRIQVTLVNPLYGKKLDQSLFVYVNRFDRRRE